MKRTVVSLLAAAALFLAAGLSLPGQNRYPVLSVNHPDGQYAEGEEIVFSATAAEETRIAAEVLIDGIVSKTLSPGIITIPAGKSEVFRILPDHPSSVILRLKRTSKQDDFLDIGAVYRPADVKPMISMPSDMARFWKKEIKKMRKVRMHPVLTPVAAPDGFEAFALEIDCPGSPTPVRGYLVKPAGAAPKSLPIAMYLHSAGVSRPGNRASVETAMKYAREGAIALDINAHGYLDDQPQEYYDNLEKTTLKGYLIRDAATHQEFYYYGMFLREQRALDYLCTLKEWDGKRVLVTGASQGGAQGAALAGMDPRVTAAVLVVPGFIDMAVEPSGDRRSCTPRFFEKYGPDNPVIKLLPYYDGVNFLRLTKAKLIIEAGLSDFTCPPLCVIGGFNEAGSTDKTLLTYPSRTHSKFTMFTKEQLAEWKRNVERVRIDFIRDYLGAVE